MTDAWRGPTRACMSPRCDHTFSLAAWYSIHDGVCVCVCVFALRYDQHGLLFLSMAGGGVAFWQPKTETGACWTPLVKQHLSFLCIFFCSRKERTFVRKTSRHPIAHRGLLVFPLWYSEFPLHRVTGAGPYSWKLSNNTLSHGLHS